MATIRRRGRARGRVQGVGFRAFVKDRAEMMGLSGWVQNMPDKTVCFEAEGDEKLFGEFEKILFDGNRICSVRRIDWEDIPLAGDAGFEIRS